MHHPPDCKMCESVLAACESEIHMFGDDITNP